MGDEGGLLGRNSDSKFHDAEDRLNFVRKVYSILGVQITITTLITLIPVTNQAAADWIIANYGLIIAAMIIAIVVNCAMICC